MQPQRKRFDLMYQDWAKALKLMGNLLGRKAWNLSGQCLAFGVGQQRDFVTMLAQGRLDRPLKHGKAVTLSIAVRQPQLNRPAPLRY
jgi:hypothetical protein